MEQLYHALAKPVGTNDERVGVLGYVKWTVQVFNCPLTREILDLVEREADLMNRGRPARTLSGLRQRILNLFLQVASDTYIPPSPLPSETSTRPRLSLSPPLSLSLCDFWVSPIPKMHRADRSTTVCSSQCD